MINARAETVHEKPAYRKPFRSQRCLIPADGFYEWKRADGKQPYYFHRKDDTPLVLAGLWDHWEGENGETMDSCTIIVTEANDLMRPVHDRMPVILSPDFWETWLDTDTDTPTLLSLLTPYERSDIEGYAVSKQVNNVRHDAPELIEHES